ncbi:MAG: 3-keto-5-aminohexanoate cleavage protein [Oligoflexia bacterium]
MKPVIITCAITGAETSQARQPALPITPAQQAQASKECVEAGASVIHLHVREDDGTPSQRPDRFAEAISAIRSQAPGVVVQISTGGAVGETIENRARPLSLKPEMASLNLGTMNFGDDIFYNHPKDIVSLAKMMRDHGVVPELEIYEVGMLETAFRLLSQGVIETPLHVQFVLGVPGGMSGESDNLIFLVQRLTALSAQAGIALPDWGVAGVGRYQLPLAVQSMMMGGHVRVGFEDNIYLSKGVLAASNAQLVDRVAELARGMGRPVATLEQARQLLLSR